MSTTKKVKSAGRYHARYGIGIRRRLIEIEEKQKQLQPCPYCGYNKVKRQAAGIFCCTKCDSKFAGGAFLPQTLTGSIVTKMVTQKRFLPSLSELMEATEAIRHPSEARKTEAVSEEEKESEKTIRKKASEE